MLDLSKRCKAIRVLNAVAAGQTTQNTSIIDMQNYEAVLFLLLLNTITSGSVMTLIAQDSATNSGGSMTTITDGSGNNVQTVVTDAGGATSNQTILLDVVQPQKRYVRAQLTIGTANAALDGIVALLYRSRAVPVTPDVSVAGQSIFECAV
jgi:hypothetical protein